MGIDSLPSLPDLAPDDRFWRLDWFGECAYPGSVRRYAQPCIKVVLSPLRCDPSDRTTLHLPDSTDHQHQREVWQPISALPLLAIGDIWHQGRHYSSPDYQVEAFKRLQISPDSTSFVKAGLAIEEHFLLPLHQHPWHRHHTHSYCVAVSFDDHRRLLVPCVELIRFYFGSSSNFIQRLFTAPLVQGALWSSKRLNPENKHLHLVLGPRLSGASASDIGRIAENRFAWRAAAGIYASCQKATAQQHPAYPYTGFPFEGMTNITASGTWLPFGDVENATFLVYRLRSCSHPFPFHSLSYEAADKKVWHDRGGDTKSGENRFARGRKETQNDAVNTDPGANKTQRTSSFRSQHRFPDLVKKQIWREKIEAMPKADIFLRHADGKMVQVAFGESDRHSNTTGFDAVQKLVSTSAGSILRFVTLGLERIAANVAKEPYVRIELLCLPGSVTPVFPLPLVIDSDGVIDSCLLFANADGCSRQRNACFVVILTAEERQQIWLIVEGGSRSAQPEVLVATKPEISQAVILASEMKTSCP